MNEQVDYMTKLVTTMSRKPLFLFIDDDSSFLEVVSYEASFFDCEVDCSQTGVEGIRKAMQNDYKAIFVDLKMPGMSGIDVLKQLRQSDSKNRGRVVALTGYLDLQSLSRIEESGVLYVVQKTRVVNRAFMEALFGLFNIKKKVQIESEK